MPVVRTPLSTQLQQGPVPSMQQAWSEAKLALNQQWLDILQEMGCASGLVHSTAMSNHVEEHRLRVSPSLLQPLCNLIFAFGKGGMILHVS